MRIIQLLFLATLLLLPRGAIAADAGHTRVRAMLVIASNEKGESEGGLSAYEPTLRRILRFESYRLAGEGSANLTAPGKAAINLGHNHSLALEAQKSDGGMRLQVTWKQGERLLMNTGLAPRPGVPMVLGGPASSKAGEVWAVLLIAD